MWWQENTTRYGLVWLCLWKKTGKAYDIQTGSWWICWSQGFRSAIGLTGCIAEGDFFETYPVISLKIWKWMLLLALVLEANQYEPLELSIYWIHWIQICSKCYVFPHNATIVCYHHMILMCLPRLFSANVQQEWMKGWRPSTSKKSSGVTRRRCTARIPNVKASLRSWPGYSSVPYLRSSNRIASWRKDAERDLVSLCFTTWSWLECFECVIRKGNTTRGHRELRDWSTKKEAKIL